MIVKTYLTLILISTCLYSIGQSSLSPNLTLGAGEVLFKKGKLDAELIQEIVVTKQDEVRTEMTKRLLTNRLKHANYPFQRYFAQNLDVLFSDAAVGIKKKELLKNAAELALVVGFAEYYLRDLQVRVKQTFRTKNDFSFPLNSNASISKDEVEFLLEYMRNLSLQSRKDFYSFYFKSYDFNTSDYIELAQLIESWKVKHTDTIISKNGQRYTKIDTSKDPNFYESLHFGQKILMSLMYNSIFEFSDLNIPPYSKEENMNQQAFNKTNNIEGFAVLHYAKSDEYFSKISLLSRFKNENKNAREYKNKNYLLSPNHIYIDLIYKVLSNNEQIQGFGFFQRTTSVPEGMSTYQDILGEDGSSYIPVKTFFPPLEKTIEKRTNELLTYYELINRVIVLSKKNYNQLSEAFTKGQTLSTANIDLKVKQLRDAFVTSLSDLKLDSTQKAFIKKTYNDLSEVSTDINQINNLILYIDKTVNPKLIVDAIQNDQYRTIHNVSAELLDMLSSFGINQALDSLIKDDAKYLLYALNKFQNDSRLSSGNIEDIKRALIDLKEAVPKQYQAKITVEYAGLNEIEQLKKDLIQQALVQIDHLKPYISLLTNLSKLDEAITYDRIFKFIADMGEICSSSEVTQMVNYMVNYMDEYAVVNDEENLVSIDMEGILGDIYGRYQKNIRPRVGLHLTVGVNTLFRPDFLKSEVSGLQNESGDIITNASFVSEKIGLKIVPFDFNKKYMKGRKLTQPLVNNIHGLVYVSGLLYQIEAINSSDQFDFASLGTGLGVTFFNSLDLNVSYAGKLDNPFTDNYFNVGFDIQFTEYLSALNKKRQQKKLQEQD